MSIFGQIIKPGTNPPPPFFSPPLANCLQTTNNYAVTKIILQLDSDLLHPLNMSRATTVPPKPHQPPTTIIMLRLHSMEPDTLC